MKTPIIKNTAQEHIAEQFRIMSSGIITDDAREFADRMADELGGFHVSREIMRISAASFYWAWLNSTNDNAQQQVQPDGADKPLAG